MKNYFLSSCIVPLADGDILSGKFSERNSLARLMCALLAATFSPITNTHRNSTLAQAILNTHPPPTSINLCCS
ncbi:hypothetical protein SprV_0100402500 [Sparganum proliferum]